MNIEAKEEILIKEAFCNAYEKDLSDLEKAERFLLAWKQLRCFLNKRPNFLNDRSANNSIEREIRNWAIDTVESLHAVNLHKEEILVNEDILKINWRNLDDSLDALSHENAKRSIADAHVLMGDIEKACELYEDYLKKDELWGFGWLGYCWVLEEHNKEKFLKIIEELYVKISNNVDFREGNDLKIWLHDQFVLLGDKGKVEFLKKLI